MIAPNFVSVRLTDTDKTDYIKAAEHAQRATGLQLTQADVYRMAMAALIEKQGAK